MKAVAKFTVKLELPLREDGDDRSWEDVARDELAMLCLCHEEDAMDIQLEWRLIRVEE